MEDIKPGSRKRVPSKYGVVTSKTLHYCKHCLEPSAPFYCEPFWWSHVYLGHNFYSLKKKGRFRVFDSIRKQAISTRRQDKLKRKLDRHKDASAKGNCGAFIIPKGFWEHSGHPPGKIVLPKKFRRTKAPDFAKKPRVYPIKVDPWSHEYYDFFNRPSKTENNPNHEYISSYDEEDFEEFVIYSLDNIHTNEHERLHAMMDEYGGCISSVEMGCGETKGCGLKIKPRNNQKWVIWRN